MDRHRPSGQRAQIVHGDGTVQGVSGMVFNRCGIASSPLPTCTLCVKGGDLRQAISRSARARAAMSTSNNDVSPDNVVGHCRSDSVRWWHAKEQNVEGSDETSRRLTLGIKLQWATQICEALEYLVLSLCPRACRYLWRTIDPPLVVTCSTPVFRPSCIGASICHAIFRFT